MRRIMSLLSGAALGAGILAAGIAFSPQPASAVSSMTHCYELQTVICCDYSDGSTVCKKKPQ